MGNAQTRRMVVELKSCGNDFEWYPSSDLMVETIKKDIDEIYTHQYPSILDCGAGDGRVLKKLTNGDKYAIEKSKPLLASLDSDIFIVGTEFEAQTLIDLKASVVFSNPPYSVYEEWATKIITEANASYIYLIIPSRWKSSDNISAALKLRSAEAKILGSFDFLNAERQARAKVDIVKVTLCYESRHMHSSDNPPKEDPFSCWFDANFKIEIAKTEQSKYSLDNMFKSSLNEKVSNELVKGGNIVSTLEELYQADLEKLINTYQSLGNVDPLILKELDVNLEGVKKALSLKIEGLKDSYWKELFNNLNTVTEKLIASSREKLLSTLTAHTHVDFSCSNAHAVVGWVIKNSNFYFNDQLISMVETLTERANIVLYKSNKKTFGDQEWKYCRKPENLDRYQLDYRIVLERVGGLNTSSWEHEGVNGLSKRSAIFLNDLCTIAANLGYNTKDLHKAESFTWYSNCKNAFMYRDIKTGELKTLFEAKAFKNGNIHLRLCPKFICRLNVEFGRLKGWLKSPKEAVDEMGVSESIATMSFGSNLQLTGKNILALEFQSAA
ncbi:MAG: DUF4942 domain-containing protein [Methylococcales bacterium]